MLGFFPAAYNDELLYSICARYSRLVGHSNHKTTLEHLFQRRTLTAVFDLPTHLDALVGQLAHLDGPSADELIERHTLLPFYAAFHSADRILQFKDAMRGDGQPHWLLGLMASQVSAVKSLRYCPQCVLEDRQELGETYWRRHQQLPGVIVCPEHKVWLEDSDVRVPALSTRHVFWAAEECIPGNGLSRQFNNSMLLMEIAQRAENLLQWGNWSRDEKLRQERYLSALAALNLATYSGQIRIEALLTEFRAFLPEALAHQFGIHSAPKDWLLRLLRKPRAASHTLYHLIFQIFAGLSFGDLEQPFLPFGPGPWPCLNHASEHYREDRITSVSISYTSNERAPIGEFACSCGFTYRRTGPDQQPEDVFKLDRMARYGPVWTQKLRDSWMNPDLSLRELSRILGFDPATVKKQAALLGLPPARPGSRGGRIHQAPNPSAPRLVNIRERDRQRKRWQKARRETPAASVNALRKQLPATYTWLYRNDRLWLRKHQPTQTFVQASCQRIDWKTRDSNLVLELRQAAQRLKRRQPFIRVSPSRLVREIGQATLLTRHLNRLPSCAKALATLTESREAFALRRIKVATSRLLKSRERVSYSQFMRWCGLRPELLNVPPVKSAFEEAWRNLQASREVTAA